MKVAMSVLNGAAVGFVISVVRPYDVMDWQWWVAILTLLTVNVLYANTK